MVYGKAAPAVARGAFRRLKHPHHAQWPAALKRQSFWDLHYVLCENQYSEDPELKPKLSWDRRLI